MSKKMYIFYTILLLLLTYVTPYHVWSFDLTILHTNDVHSYLGGIKEETGKPCFTSTTPHCIGGMVRLAQSILDIRQSTPNTILLDAGDHFVGTAFHSDFLDTPDKLPFIEFVNRLGYVATAPGNHEFDHGCYEFFSAIRQLNFPVVVANLTFTDPEMQSSITPWIIVEREGKRIGIIGLLAEGTATSSKACSQAVFSNAEQALRNAIKEIKKQNVFTIIVLSHLGTNVDIELASKVNDVSVFVGGHTHTLLSNTYPKAYGPYPIVKYSPSGHPVLVVTAKEKLEYLGRLNVTFDEQGIPQKWNGDVIRLDKPVTNDPAIVSIAALLDSYGKPIKEKLEVKVGEIANPNDPTFDTSKPSNDLLDGKPFFYCRKEEGLTANIILDAVLEAGRSSGAQVAIMTTGLIRGPLPIGRVQKLDVVSAMPTEDKLYVGEMTGKVLQEAIEHGVSKVHCFAFVGTFLQVSGLRVTLNAEKPVGERIQSIEYLHNGIYEPLDLNKTYRVVANGYLAGGNDGFIMLKDIKWTDIQKSPVEAVISYLKEHSPLNVKKDGRIVNVTPIIVPNE